MKLKKILGIFIISIITLSIMLGLKTYAKEASYTLGLTNIRETGGAYEIHKGDQIKKIWKIVSYPSGNSINYSNAFYCLRAEKGFAINGAENVTSIRKTYNTSLDMKTQKSDVLARLQRVDAFKGIDASTAYNKIMWIIDNMYLPKQPGAADTKKALLDAAGITDSDYTVDDAEITDDDIEVIQQLALWHYTNADDNNYNSNVLPSLYFNGNSGNDSNYRTFADIYPNNDQGRYRQEEAEMLYTYLITEANNNASYTSKDAVSPLTLDKSRIQIKNENGKYIIGPVKIQTNSQLAYTLKQIGLVDGNENEFREYTILNSDKTQYTGTTWQNLFGKDFYISVPENTSVETIKFNFKITYNRTTATYYTTSDSTYTGEQPVVLVEKNVPEHSDSFTVTIPKKQEFDLALRKFITKIGETTYNRAPTVDVSKLKTGAATTATYTHPKNPLFVEKGDIVTYTLRIYNEGQIAGYAKEITDYLPNGLELLENSEINTQNGWTKVAGTNKITTTALANKLIPAFNGTTLAYEDVQVQCRVIANITQNDQTLRNIAEISKDAGPNGEPVEDRDSDPNNVRTDRYEDKSQEDDDDFEKLILKGKVFDLALRKFITKIGETTYNRAPTVDVSKLKAGTATTATYTHPKNALIVEKGDIVTYTLRIYNEGQMAGYAKEITDYLPNGLELLENSEINTKNGWTKVVGTNKITTTALANKLIPAFNGTTLAYEDVQVQCRVIANITQNDQTLRNIAEISKDAGPNGEQVKDRDSEPNNVNTDRYEDKSQQDDDDFEKLILKGKYFDLALRKFITKVNGKEVGKNRAPVVDTTKLKSGEETTAIYTGPKTPVAVKKGDIVTYTIRVYNEGMIDGYAQEITDHLPEQLEFLPEDEENINNGWVYDEKDTTLRTIRTTHLSKQTNEDNIIEKFDGNELKYKDVTIKCKVKDTVNPGDKITNIADITDFVDKEGKPITDRDSQKANVVLPPDEQLPEYKQEQIDRGDVYIPGQQDDDDFEKLEIQIFDLALRKFITKVEDKDITTRIPNPQLSNEGKISYKHPKDPVEVRNGNTVIYTIRVYNEGDIAGYAQEITDNLPEGLLYLPENQTNTNYRWKMIDKNGQKTTKVEEAVKITTDYLSKEQEKTPEENLLKAFNKEAGITNNNPDYRDVKVAFKVIEPETSERILINTAEISEDADEEGKPVEDIDSTPDNNDPNEDDIDIEKVKLVYFDLALRKFITKVGTTDINNRVPKPELSEDGKITYVHPKDPVEVNPSDIVTYTIRVYNEGKIAGYAQEVTDDLPKGLLYLPENETNTNYRWKMIDKDGKETTKVEEAVKITTDYLSKEQEKQSGANLIKAFNKQAGITNSNPDYRDVKIAFKVVEPETSDRIIINTAEISEDADEEGKPVEDIDSTPDNNKPDEDDIDTEKIKVRYFDLSLKKWVTQAIVIKDGKQTITNTGHTGDENPEPVVKVDLKKSDIKKVTVKFAYKIKVTNEGQIDGYAKEVKDYIPDGLKFVAKDNPQWKQLSEKEVVTEQLANTLLKPGQSATVDIILTWENDANNFGKKVNIAEISKDYNESHTPDIDSTPNNKVPGEDDIDDAPVLLSVRTGQIRMYFGLTTIILVILAGGVYMIKKYVLK